LPACVLVSHSRISFPLRSRPSAALRQGRSALWICLRCCFAPRFLRRDSFWLKRKDYSECKEMNTHALRILPHMCLCYAPPDPSNWFVTKRGCRCKGKTFQFLSQQPILSLYIFALLTSPLNNIRQRNKVFSKNAKEEQEF
ncbi:hypothetical protein EJB05_12401, partial [Eragrostis curvula]